MSFKGNFCPIFAVVWSVRGSGLMATIGRGSGFITWWWLWLQFHDKSAPIAGRSGHDRTAIVSHDRESCVVATVRWRSGAPESPTHRPSEMKILAIWWRSHGRNVSTQCLRSRKIVTVHAVSLIAKNHVCPMKRSSYDEDWALPMDALKIAAFLQSSFVRWRSGSPCASTCRQVRRWSTSLKPHLSARGRGHATTRVHGGARAGRHVAGKDGSRRVHGYSGTLVREGGGNAN